VQKTPYLLFEIHKGDKNLGKHEQRGAAQGGGPSRNGKVGEPTLESDKREGTAHQLRGIWGRVCVHLLARGKRGGETLTFAGSYYSSGGGHPRRSEQ